MSPTIYIVTAVHNSLAHTKKFLRSLEKQDFRHYRLVIVDDGSTDQTRKYIQLHAPSATLITGTGNLYWTAGINQAIRAALKQAQHGDYILTVNNDCTLPPNYLRLMLETIQQFPNSILGSFEIEQGTHKVHSGYLSVDWQSGRWLNELSPQGVKFCGHLSTKGTIFPVKVFSQLGLLDADHLPHYGSDFEFTNRARLSGYQLVVNSECKVSCDHERTGLQRNNKKITYSQVWSLMWSRKSTINLKDHYYLVRLMCPPELKIRNYLRLLIKGLSLLAQPFKSAL